ncbi:MAG: hypothetical protein ACXABY_19705 [Candidatus Thorarchaeota archaeon]|jgi:hypothetical protein
MALGQETEKKLIVMQVNNRWVLQISSIFLVVNDIPDARQRKIEFANRLDSFIDAQYEAVGK